MNKPNNGAFLEPESAFNQDQRPQYPLNSGHYTESGHCMEFDDTPGRERVRLQHRIGSYTEIGPDGTEVHKVIGDSYDITIKNKNVLIKGVCNITIEGDANIVVEGNKYEHVKGDYNLLVGGDFVQTSKGTAKIVSDGDMDISAGSFVGGSIRMTSGDQVYVSSDIRIKGELTATKITSQTRIDAGTGMIVGPLGIATLGGLNVGIPGPTVPGVILSTVSVISPSHYGQLGQFTLMNAVWMRDIVNKGIYNSHFHISPKGPTGSPILPMI